ncbi:MAG: hypothetical protein JXB14_03130 [Candidatus Altiarchaeota archaeon]|nr:hypothetical protein [Candidatus Altiarchaeota archaeon]
MNAKGQTGLEYLLIIIVSIVVSISVFMWADSIQKEARVTGAEYANKLYNTLQYTFHEPLDCVLDLGGGCITPPQDCASVNLVQNDAGACPTAGDICCALEPCPGDCYTHILGVCPSGTISEPSGDDWCKVDDPQKICCVDYVECTSIPNAYCEFSSCPIGSFPDTSGDDSCAVNEVCCVQVAGVDSCTDLGGICSSNCGTGLRHPGGNPQCSPDGLLCCLPVCSGTCAASCAEELTGGTPYCNLLKSGDKCCDGADTSCTDLGGFCRDDCTAVGGMVQPAGSSECSPLDCCVPMI